MSKTAGGMGDMAQKLEKTKNTTQWLAQELEKCKLLNPNSEYISVLSSFQRVSEGILKAKETLDPMYDHYEVLPRKIEFHKECPYASNEKISDMAALLSAKRDPAFSRYQNSQISETLPMLFGATEKELKNDEGQMQEVYKQVLQRNQNCTDNCNGMLKRLEGKTNELKKQRRLKGTTMKGDFYVVNETGYQNMIDRVYGFLNLV